MAGTTSWIEEKLAARGREKAIKALRKKTKLVKKDVDELRAMKMEILKEFDDDELDEQVG